MTSANESNLVPGHYASAYMHWDYSLNVGMGYLESAATKYVVRWRQKDGVEGLRKALHYLNKLDENRARALEIVCRAHHDTIVEESARFAEANALPPMERAFVWRLSSWSTEDDLADARDILMQLLDEAEPPARGPLSDPRPVPLTEENHYAERSDRQSAEGSAAG